MSTTPGDPRISGLDAETVSEVVAKRPAIAIALTVSKVDQEWIDHIRRASYELSIERGHMRRG